MCVCRPAEGNISQHSDGFIVRYHQEKVLNRGFKKRCVGKRGNKKKYKKTRKKTLGLKEVCKIKVSKTVTPHGALTATTQYVHANK